MALSKETRDKIEAYLPKLVEFLRIRTRNNERAEDIAQKACVRVFSTQAKRSDFEIQHVPAYLQRTAMRLLFDDARDNKRREQHESACDDTHFANYEAGTAFDPLHPVIPNPIAKAQAKIIYNRVAQMSEQRQAIFSLVFEQECGYEEVAQKLGLATGTIKSNVFRMRQELQHALAQEQGTTAILDYNAA
jgi:RNA polymerase sigma factor (sigma-70 family)